MNKLLFIYLIGFFLPILPKVLLITHSYNRPDFIEIQHKTFKKFLQDDYEFVVFNDARNEEISRQIIQTCQKYSLSCIRIPQEIHDRPYLERLPEEIDWNHPAIRCANVVQYSLDVLGFDHDGIVAIIDSDMFLIHEFSIEKYLKDFDIAGHPQSRSNKEKIIEYLWNGIVFINMESLANKRTLNFNCGRVDGIPVDAGGHTAEYFRDNPNAKLHYLELQHLCDESWCDLCKKNNSNRCTHNTEILKKLKFNDPLISLIQSGKFNMELFLNDVFLHYRGGGNWDYKSEEYHQQKTNCLLTFIEAITK